MSRGFPEQGTDHLRSFEGFDTFGNQQGFGDTNEPTGKISDEYGDGTAQSGIINDSYGEMVLVDIHTLGSETPTIVTPALSVDARALGHLGLGLVNKKLLKGQSDQS